MNNDILVSIIVAAFNAEAYIGDCLNCLVNQDYQNIEILVCNDCSTDETLAIVERYADQDSRIIIINNETNLKATTSRNKCINSSNGQYIMIQDADDVCESNRVSQLLKILIDNPNYDFVSSGHYLFDDAGIYKTVIPTIEKPQKINFLYGSPFCHAATLFQKECLVKVNGYRVSKETRRGQDYDLFMRLYSNGFKGLNISNVLYGYRVDQNTISRRKIKYRLDECKIRYRGFKSLGLLPLGFPYILKPIAAHFLQSAINIMRRKNDG